ncbi:MAG: type II toxin-antitoxin system PemK/MazF family toxin [Bacteroidota bacterium]
MNYNQYTIKRGQIWWANLDPARGTEAGKIRPVVILQTDLLNDVGHPSSIVCPLTLPRRPLFYECIYQKEKWELRSPQIY